MSLPASVRDAAQQLDQPTRQQVHQREGHGERNPRAIPRTISPAFMRGPGWARSSRFVIDRGKCAAVRGGGGTRIACKSAAGWLRLRRPANAKQSEYGPITYSQSTAIVAVGFAVNMNDAALAVIEQRLFRGLSCLLCAAA